MMGQKSSLPDIILDQIPDPACLRCEETIPPDDDNDKVEQHQPYSVISCCGSCGRQVKIACLADSFGIKSLEQLLFGSLKILCVQCVKTNRF